MEEVLKGVLLLPYVLYLCLKAFLVWLIPEKYKSKDVKGEVVLITGGGSGIGRLLALRFSRLGCRLVIWDVNDQGSLQTQRLITEDGGDCRVYSCDVSDREAVYRLAKKVKEEVGPVTILVNNAGIIVGNSFLDLPDHLIEKTFQINSIAHFWTCKAFLPDMISNNHGHIVTISSIAGLTGCANMADYCASKFAAVGLHETLTFELRIQNLTGIKTTLICPFFTNTGMFSGVDPGFVGILEPDYVADQIVSAVRTEQIVLVIPSFYSWILGLKGLFPVSVGLHIRDFLKSDSHMKDFKGRGMPNSK